MSTNDVKEEVKRKYGSAGRAVSEKESLQACREPGHGLNRDPSRDSALRCCDPITTNLYSEGEKWLIPEAAVLASLGCGNATALIELKAGEVVLDLGVGGGIDVLLSEQVSLEPTRVYEIADARHFLTEAGLDVKAMETEAAGKFLSALVRAVMPALVACCGPGFCAAVAEVKL